MSARVLWVIVLGFLAGVFLRSLAALSLSFAAFFALLAAAVILLSLSGGSRFRHGILAALALLALAEAKRRGLARREIEVRMDSELIQRQLTDEYQIKEETLWPQYMKVHNLLVANFENIRFVHVRREENNEADRLVNEAIDGA